MSRITGYKCKTCGSLQEHRDMDIVAAYRCDHCGRTSETPLPYSVHYKYGDDTPTCEFSLKLDYGNGMDICELCLPECIKEWQTLRVQEDEKQEVAS